MHSKSSSKNIKRSGSIPLSGSSLSSFKNEHSERKRKKYPHRDRTKTNLVSNRKTDVATNTSNSNRNIKNAVAQGKYITNGCFIFQCTCLHLFILYIYILILICR